MDDFIIHQNLEYTNDDFDFKIIKLGDDEYNGFVVNQHHIVRINEKEIKVTTSWMNVDDFLSGWNYDQEIIEECKQSQIESLKYESILIYINMESSRFKRKLKLEKINN